MSGSGHEEGETGPGQRGRVLVIDDSEVMAELLSANLEDEGFEVASAGSGQAGLELAGRWTPDVVVCDLFMPEMDGFEVLRRLAAVDPTLPVVMLTAAGDLDTVLRAVHQGVFDFVPKSGDPTGLSAAVTRAAVHARVVRENRRLAAEVHLANAELERRVDDRTAQLGEANGRLEASLAALNTTEARFRSLVQNAADIITVVAEGGQVLYESPAAERILGYPAEGRVGQSAFATLDDDEIPAARRLFVEALNRPGASRSGKLRFRHRDGSHRWMEVSLTNLVGDPSVGGVVWNCRDVTERTALEEQLTHDAFHDGLTKLANRVLFRERVEQALLLARHHRAAAAVIFIDLDGFKAVNDTLGHAAGDELLSGFAERLRGWVRPIDCCARLGGDEFALLLQETHGEGAVAVAQRIQKGLAEPFRVQGKDVVIGASLGIASTAGSQGGVDELLRNADLAMYSAKARHDGGYQVFRPSMHIAMAERMDLELELRRALERGELFVQYQPTVEIRTGRVIGMEALVRWRHATRGVIPPVVFIPLAEDTGLIVPLGRWVLRQACAMLQKWQPIARCELTMNVNLSPKQLRHGDLVDEVRGALEEFGIAPRQLALEITENIALEEQEPVVHALKALGIKLAIDDFGTGYSSLGYLRRLAVDVLKIDKSFIDSVAHTSKEAELARAMIRLGMAMGLQTTAEGIETLEQWKELRALGCDSGQGYYFARPLDAEAMPAVLRKGRLGAELPPDLPLEATGRDAPAGFSPRSSTGARPSILPPS